MTLGLEVRCKVPHAGHDGQDLLGVVPHVVHLGMDFHQHVNDIGAHLDEPAVTGVELVTQDQSQRGHGKSVSAGQAGLQLGLSFT